jgi:hypothetical protein
MVTSAHRVDVKVGANGLASALPSGAAAAVPPASAKFHYICQNSLIFLTKLFDMLLVSESRSV